MFPLALIAPEVAIAFSIIVAIGIPLIALVDILKNEFKGNDKLIWVLIIIFLGIIGAILYYFIGRQQKLPNEGKQS